MPITLAGSGLSCRALAVFCLSLPQTMGLFSKVKEAVKGRDEPAKSTTQPAPEQQPSARRPSFADEVTQANRADMHHEPFHGTIHAAQHGQPESALQRNTSKSGAGTFFGLSKLNRQKSTTNGSTATKAAPLVPHQQRPVRVANASSIQDAIGRALSRLTTSTCKCQRSSVIMQVDFAAFAMKTGRESWISQT